MQLPMAAGFRTGGPFPPMRHREKNYTEREEFLFKGSGVNGQGLQAEQMPTSEH